jgi:hypothetical protein
MVFVRGRCTEQREDAIAGRLYDITVVATDGIDHQLERRIDDRPRLFWVKASINSIDPLMSANSAVTVLRSPSGIFTSVFSTATCTNSAGFPGGLPFSAVCSSGAEHSSQNFAPGRLPAPQRGHFTENGDAHSLQNFASSRFSTPQLEQRIA